MPIFPPYLVPYSELVTPSDTSSESLVCQCPESVAETIAEDVARGPYSYCLERLDYDMLEVIYEYLRPAFGLRPLALTCKWLRESCKPVLFRRSLVRADLVTKEHFLPSHLGIYVHSLTFVGGWKYPTPPCPRYRPASLSELFTRTPHLSRVNIKVTRPSGVPWLAIDEILTLPRLRILDIDNTLNYHTRRPDDLSHQVLTSLSAPLTTYRQILEDYHSPPRRLPSDADAIACVIGQKQVQQSLEYLTLPSEIAPLAALEAAHWPKVKTVSL
ncbi:hypothetical protein PYCCODRAFT_799268 [Trametes coccinea BRFM310]|uniref:F-box domain-containing protein n=1 Tax=Trametes coccinea (strain BRFM310) TaxID=1353009 RepID=A0A1Y2J2K0_TRAC3|nr:hypothetical protein PYCCODRAFT_799268 [Trametes coccinea BRFM310]